MEKPDREKAEDPGSDWPTPASSLSAIGLNLSVDTSLRSADWGQCG